MKPIQFATLFLTAAVPGCLAPTEKQVRSANGEDPLRIVERQLVVLPVFAASASSGFPISTRNVMAAGHALNDGLRVAAVRGEPMLTLMQAGVPAPPPERDFAVLYGTHERFQPNILDGAVELEPGDVVYFGGYRGETYPYDARPFIFRKPEIVIGRVIENIDAPHGRLVAVEVPYGVYRGFSGGPAAILDDENQVRVFGVTAVAGGRWHPTELRRYSVIQVARFTQEEIERVRYAQIVHPGDHRGRRP